MVVFAMLVMLVDIFDRSGRTTPRALSCRWVALAGVVVTGGVCASGCWASRCRLSRAWPASDHFALGVDFVVLIAAGLGILVSVNYIPAVNKQMGEYYALLLLGRPRA